MKRTPATAIIEDASRRETVLVLAGLAVLIAFAWLYTIGQAAGMSGHAEHGAWNPHGFLALAVMWIVMMAAMMLPTVAPAVLILAAVSRKRRQEGGPALPLAFFLLGYLLAWSLFSVLGALIQHSLNSWGLMTAVMSIAAGYWPAAVLALAGVFQFSRLKAACLQQCRSPAGFLADHWKDGPLGVLEMGLRHGLFCIGCCWALMGILFVTGVMHLGWMAALTVLMLAEKVVPRAWAKPLSYLAGAACLLAAIFILWTNEAA